MRDRKFTPNDNGSVIRMLSGRYVKRNRGRNRILLGAVILGIVTLTMDGGTETPTEETETPAESAAQSGDSQPEA